MKPRKRASFQVSLRDGRCGGRQWPGLKRPG